jgi:hypothetical protein
MVLFIVVNSKAAIGMAKVPIRFQIDPHTLANGSKDGIMVSDNVFGRYVIDCCICAVHVGCKYTEATGADIVLPLLFPLSLLQDGRVYKGEWKEGKAHGYGVEKRSNGTIRHEGMWDKDNPVRKR